MTNTRKLVILSFLVALTVVLARFLSFKIDVLRMSFEFFPIAVAAMVFGPIAGGITGMVADLIGAILFPSGTFFPGFTISAFLTGIIYGLFLYKSKVTLLKTIACVLVKLLVIDMVLVSAWLMIMYKMPLSGLVVTRLVKFAVMLPVETVLLYFGARPLIDRLKKRTGLLS
ncbi:MAG: folate family ECF transporter S component [Clostridia bacterium]